LGQKGAIVLIVAWLVLVAGWLARGAKEGAAPQPGSRDNEDLFEFEER
jgi:hypothetical protein